MDTLENKLLLLKASDIMVPATLTSRPDESLSKALSLMDRHHRYEIPVVDGNKIVGLISYTVLVKRRNLPLSVPVERVMYPAPTISPDMPVPSISEILLTDDYRSVPVIKKEKLLGMVTRRNIIKKLLEEQIHTEIPVMDIMSSPVTTVEENDDISKALHEMNHLDERSLPVVDDLGRLSGIIALDHLDKFLRGKRERASQGEIKGERVTPRIEIKSAMSVPPLSVSLDSVLSEVMRKIVDRKVSTIIVVDEGIPVGIVTSLDIIELVASAQPREEVLVQISGFEADDPYIYDSIYYVVQRYLPKLTHHITPKVINLHITHHHHLDSMKKFTVSARLTSARKTFITKKNDWDLLKVLDEVMDSMVKQAKKYKERTRGRPRV